MRDPSGNQGVGGGLALRAEEAARCDAVEKVLLAPLFPIYLIIRMLPSMSDINSLEISF